MSLAAVRAVRRLSLSAYGARRALSATVGRPAPFEYNVRFDGKRAVVTGASKGIGRATTLALADLGAEVIAVSRTGVEELAKEHKNIIPVSLDVDQLENIEPALANIGDVDLLVNNAGIAYLADFVDHDIAETEKVMRVNTTASMVVGQVVARNLIQRGAPGSIVNVSSQGSQVGLDGHTAYCMSKGAMDQLTRTMALELGRKNIRVNAVNPTVVLTAMGRKAWSDPEKAAPMLARIPLGRFAEEVDVVNVILFLLSERAAMINGATVPVEGGFWSN